MTTARRTWLAARWPLTRLGLGLGGGTALVILVLWWGSLFIQVQLRLNDSYFVPTPTTGTVVLVALDDASHAQYGRSIADWPRRVYGNLVAIVSRAGARVVAFDLMFSEPTSDDNALVTAIRAARQSEYRTRAVMPLIGINPLSTASTPQTLQFQGTLLPNDRLRGAVDYLGSVNTFSDADSTVRRQPSLVQTGDDTHVSLPLAAYLAYLRVPPAAIPDMVVPAGDSLQVVTRQLPVDTNGLWRPYFFGPPSTPGAATFPVFSARDVLAGDIAPENFQDKIVLIGLMNRTGGTDVYFVPTSSAGQMMAGVEIHANAVESLLQGRFVTEQSYGWQAATIILLAVLAGGIYINLKWYWIFPAAAILVLAGILAAAVRFATALEITNLFHTSLALALPAVIVLAYDVGAESARRRRTEFLLQSVVQVSHQRLMIDRILPLLADDIQRVTGAVSGAIWLADDETGTLAPRYHWQHDMTAAPDFTTISERAQHTRRLVVEPDMAAHPVIWQQQLLGVITIQKPHHRLAGRGSLRLFTLLTEQAAPSLESALLYTQTQRQTHLLETVLAGSPAAVAVTDGDLKITTANAAFADALPAFESGQQAELLALLTAADAPPELPARISKSAHARQPFRHELTIGKRSFTLDAAPLDFGGWVVILNDVSTLVELSALKTQMLRIASHDLKKPLSRVVGYGSLILDTPEKDSLSPVQLDYIQRIAQAGDEMTQIINQILHMEQLRSRRIQRAPVDMAAIVNEAVNRYYNDATARQLTVTTEIADNLPNVSGDAYLLLQIVANLVENAVKYTPNGGTITVRAYPCDMMLRLEVEDTGLGIPDYAQARIFEDFYRVRTPETQQISGTGLGLGLAKALVTAHDGRIWVRSIEKAGSTFYVEIPAADS